jgi:diguanylate cyclase (GGDEF)-like protein
MTEEAPGASEQYDDLTGLLNRLGFRDHIDAALGAARAQGTSIGLLFLDLDDFKRVNDTHGHEAGDEVIRRAAARIGSITRAGDVVARLGGDEFAVTLTGIESEAQVRSAEARLRVAFIEPFIINGEPVTIGVSVGGGMWPNHGRSVGELVRHADNAMYRAKERGRVERSDRNPSSPDPADSADSAPAS